MSKRASASDTTTAAIMRQFNEAFLRHEPGLLDDLVADDCVIENTQPAPNGSRHVGRAACLELWRGIASDRQAWFEPEAIIALGERAIIQWRYRWGEGNEQSVRGVNLMRVRDGLIVEGLGYVKGA